MSLILDGSLGITTPAETVTGNTILGDASTDTLNVGNGGLVKDASGNVGIGTTSPSSKVDVVAQDGLRITGYQPFTTLRDSNDSNKGFRLQAASGNTLFSVDATGGGTYTERMRIDSSGNLLFNSGYGSVATAYGCRAWVNFNGTGTVAIRASGNVSSITDNGTGDYTVNFTTAMVDANYAQLVTAGRINDKNNIFTLGYQTTYAGNKTTTFCRITTQSSTLTLTDMDMIDCSIFR